MRILLGILTIIVFVGTTFSSVKSCIDSHQSLNEAIIEDGAHQSSAETKGNNSHHCPLTNHSANHHCHGPCFQVLMAHSFNFKLIVIENLVRSSDFRAPLAPHLEGNKRPPKIS